MPSLFRSISQRFRRSTKRRPNGQPGPSGYQQIQGIGAPEMDHKRQCQCKVMLLDGTDLNVVTSKNALGQEVYDQVFYTLDLEERDYFGLLFMDHYQVQHWLDPLKKLSKQVPIGPPYTFRFSVKFFSSEPSNLREELTRYQFFLQLKQDIQTGKLDCPKETAIELAALALQSEFGDYNPTEHTPAFVSEFRFHPEQDEEMEIAILEKFITSRGQSPATAELNYLNKARWIELYGVDMHIVEGKDGNSYRLGLTPTGMLVFDGNQKIGLFFWEKIQKLDFRNRKLTLVVEEDADQASGQVQLHTFVFNLASHKACKHLWKCAIEYHTFFRLKFHQAKQRKTSQLFRLGSTFKYRGRTEYETVHKDGGRLSRRQTSTFERRPSQRYGPRQTLINKRLQIRNEVKQQVAASAGLAIPDVLLPAESSKPVVEAKRVEESRVAVGVPAAPHSDALLGTRPSPVGSSATPQAERPPNKIAAAEARLDNLIFSNRELASLPPTTVKQLDESPTASRRLLNGTRASSTAGDSIHPNTPKCDPRIDVRLNALNDGDRWAVPPSAHVTTIAVGNTTTHTDGRSCVTSTPTSRIPKYTSSGPCSSSPTASAVSPSGSSSVTSTAAPVSSMIPRMATSPVESCQKADLVTPITSNGIRKDHSPTSAVGIPPSGTVVPPPLSVSSVSPSSARESSADVNIEVKSSVCITPPSRMLTPSSTRSGGGTSPASASMQSITNNESAASKITTPSAVTPSGLPSASVNRNSPMASKLPVLEATSVKVEEKPENVQTAASPSVDAEKPRSKLPVRSESVKGSPLPGNQPSTAKLEEKTSQSRIPKMASGHKPHQYFGQSPHIEKSGCGVTTYIPIVRTGLPSTQSRIITDL